MVEYIESSSACDEITWCLQSFHDLNYVLSETTVAYEDNAGAIDLSYNPDHHKRTKHINIRYHAIPEKVEDGSIKRENISTELIFVVCNMTYVK